MPPEEAAELPPDAREVRLATTIAAFGAMASAPVCARLGAAGVGAHERALLLDVLLDCGVETERHACCFAEAAQHADDWVRHNALQGLEMTSGGDEAARAMLAAALADRNDMVAFTAVSALFHHDAARGRAGRASPELARAAARMEAEGRQAMLCFKAARIAEFNGGGARAAL